MKIQEMRELTPEERAAAISETRKEIVELRFQLSMRKLESPARIGKARRKLARLLTVETELKKEAEKKAEPAASAS